MANVLKISMSEFLHMMLESEVIREDFMKYNEYLDNLEAEGYTPDEAIAKADTDYEWNKEVGEEMDKLKARYIVKEIMEDEDED